MKWALNDYREYGARWRQQVSEEAERQEEGILTLLAKPGWLKMKPGVLPGPGAESGQVSAEAERQS